MKLTFFGAAHEVTGSCTLLEAAGRRILIDCGMEQGADIYENCELPMAAGELDAVLLTHAHIDHSGKLPALVAQGFRGPIYATEAARALMDWGYHRLGIRHFIAHCDAGNEPSQAVMRRLGMICTDDTHTRKNRGSDELRRELLFEVWV